MVAVSMAIVRRASAKPALPQGAMTEVPRPFLFDGPFFTAWADLTSLCLHQTMASKAVWIVTVTATVPMLSVTALAHQHHALGRDSGTKDAARYEARNYPSEHLARKEERMCG